jgi:hypothetical protein
MVEEPVLKWLLAAPGFPRAPAGDCAEAALPVPMMRHTAVAKARIPSNMIVFLG